jgi:hypothetical protein
MRTMAQDEAADTRLTLHDLREMAAGRMPAELSDLDFLEALASCQCLVMAPWVYHQGADGALQTLTPLRYDSRDAIDKPVTLLAALQKLPHAGV